MDDAELLRHFEARTLPFAQWTHRAHVRVAYLYLQRHPFPQALDRLRAGIQAYNAANNVPEGPTSGYNETTTVAFLHLIAATLAAYGSVMPTQLLTRHALRLFYSPQRRMHPSAKTQFIEPDLAPLPQKIE